MTQVGGKSTETMSRNEVESRLRNAVIGLCDEVKRLDQSVGRCSRATELARQWGLSERDIAALFQEATRGRPDRVRALERYGKGEEGQPIAPGSHAIGARA